MALNMTGAAQGPPVPGQSAHGQPFFNPAAQNVEGAYGNHRWGPPTPQGQHGSASMPPTSIPPAQNSFSFQQNMQYPGRQVPHLPTSMPYPYPLPSTLQMPNDFFNGHPPFPPPYPSIPFPHQGFPAVSSFLPPPPPASQQARTPIAAAISAPLPPTPPARNQAPTPTAQKAISPDKAVLPRGQSSTGREEGELSDTGMAMNQDHRSEQTLNGRKQLSRTNMGYGVDPSASDRPEGRGSRKEHHSECSNPSDLAARAEDTFRVLTYQRRLDFTRCTWRCRRDASDTTISIA